MTKNQQNPRSAWLRRLLSLLLGLVLFMELLPGGLTVVSDAAAALTVTQDGAAVSAVTLPQSERVTLEALSGGEDMSYRWQIAVDGEWLNISGADDAPLTLTYAMLLPALENGSAQVRCAAGDGTASDPVRVTVAYDVEDSAAQLAALQQENLQAQTPAPQKPRRAARRVANNEYYEIKVNYLDAATKRTIYTGFTATVNRNQEYSQTVLSPTYLGYKPYYNSETPATDDPSKATQEALSLALDIPANYEGDVYTVNVYYKPVDVPYAVRYYFQNINDDMYTEQVGYYKRSHALTGTIVTNERLALEADQTKGFTKLYHYPEAVAADGSTVFECYYDRNYYLLKFDSNGGYGAEHIYARYGAPVAVSTPTRHGYTFKGWVEVDEHGDPLDGDKIVTLPTTVPAENHSYKASWEVANTTYTVVYWLLNVDAENAGKPLSELTPADMSCLGSRTVNAIAGQVVNENKTVEEALKLEEDTIICGREEGTGHDHIAGTCYPDSMLRHYVYDNADMNVTVKGDGSTIVNMLYARRQYTLRFYYGRAHRENDNSVGYYVVGGSTHDFGRNESKRPKPEPGKYNDEALLNLVKDENWGAVQVDGGDMSSLISAEHQSQYKLGALPDGDSFDTKGNRYYYLEFTALYGADISKLWPSKVFGQVELTDAEKQKHIANGGKNNLDNGGWGNYAYFAGWNGEYNIKYTYDNADNPTIKCNMPLLNDTLLWDESVLGEYGDSTSQVSFLAFFENGAAGFNWNIPKEWTYELYIPLLPGETIDPNDPNAPKTIDWKGVTYKLKSSMVINDDSIDPSHQTCSPLTGFEEAERQKTNASTLSDGRECFTVQFFYTRNSYTLYMQNHAQRVTKTVLYQEGVDSYVDTVTNALTYPSTLEANAYKFNGWFTTPGHLPGTEYKPGTTMPAGNLSLYADWKPVQYTVNLFRTLADKQAYEADPDSVTPYKTFTISHGQVIGAVEDPDDQSGHNYNFSGWYYIKNGSKIAFTPTDTIVREDLNVYADWGALTAQPYLIHYVLDDKESDTHWTDALNTAALFSPADGAKYTVTVGAETRTYLYRDATKGYHRLVADDSRGYANEGTTRTFVPKVGDPYNQLYKDFNAGFYPTLASHSITMAKESDSSAPVNNVFVFTYVHVASVEYTVEYRYQATGEYITEADGTNGNGWIKRTTKKSVITEPFVPVPNYIPDSFYKRLILAVEKDKDGNWVSAASNVVTFYYRQDDKNAFYAVHYMLQNVDAASEEINDTNYTESTVHTEGIAALGSQIDITPQQFSGFTMKPEGRVKYDTMQTINATGSPSAFNITVRAEGTELYVYYTRNPQNCSVYYLEYGTDVTTLPPATTLRPTKTVHGRYGQVITELAETIDGYNCVSAMTQSIVLRPEDAQNYIIFYYEPLQYTVEYRVWKYGGGKLSETMETVEAKASFAGSTPTANTGYTFDGWYTDENCTIPVDGTMVDTTNKLTPDRSKLIPNPGTNVFYARFTKTYGDLTIKRENTDDEDGGSRTFVYRITSDSDPTFVMEVAVPKGGSTTVKNLPTGAYTVEQVNSWSWRYDDAAQSVTVQQDTDTTVTFDDSAKKDKWLNGSSAAVTNRKG